MKRPNSVGFWWCRPFGLCCPEDWMLVQVRRVESRLVVRCVNHSSGIGFTRLDTRIRQGWNEWSGPVVPPET